MSAFAKIDVVVGVRLSRSAKIRMFLARQTARLGMVATTRLLVRHLRYDIQIGHRKWRPGGVVSVDCGP